MQLLSISQIGMIGDSMGDFIGSDIAIQYAVGNAGKTYREAADYIAREDYARGVTEILSFIKS